MSVLDQLRERISSATSTLVMKPGEYRGHGFSVRFPTMVNIELTETERGYDGKIHPPVMGKGGPCGIVGIPVDKFVLEEDGVFTTVSIFGIRKRFKIVEVPDSIGDAPEVTE